VLKAKQESETKTLFMRGKVETVVWTERMLAALISGVKGGKWFSLWDEEANKALEEVKQWMKENGLMLHPDKTHIGNCTIEGQGFEFLGYRFECGKRTVRKTSRKKLYDTIRKRTKRTVGQSMESVIESLNPTLKGWFEYFKHAHKWTFKAVDGFVRRRLRAILRKQDKRPGRGRCLNDHRQWPNSFFATLGLFTMREAHAELASRSR